MYLWQWLYAAVALVFLDFTSVMGASNIFDLLTISRHNLLCVAGEAHAAVFGIYIELLCSGSKVLHKFSKSLGRDCPEVVCTLFDEQSMHGSHRLERQAVCFENASMNASATSQCHIQQNLPCLHIILMMNRLLAFPSPSSTDTSHFSTAVSLSLVGSMTRLLKTERRAWYLVNI